MIYLRLMNFLPSICIGLVLHFISFLSSYRIQVFAAKITGWSISKSGMLDFDVSKNVTVRPSSFHSSPNKGGIWLDFHGVHLPTKNIRGRGPIRTVRLNRINRQTSRLIIDFVPQLKVNTQRLRLTNFIRNRWKLVLIGLPTSSINTSRSVKSQSRPHIMNATHKARKKNRIIIDPGHGGPDPGAIGLNGLRETDVVLLLSLLVAQLLQDQGFQTILTRTSEIDVDLPRRTGMANRLKASIFVSIHANAMSSARSDINGIETFYYENSLSSTLAEEIQQFILTASPQTISRGVRKARFFVIRRTFMPSVLVETGFLTGSLDSLDLATLEHRQRIALAITTGILSYIKKEL
ncbi:MAG TPA: N-acetylmuramoyl-L-alanine amidase [Prochlorococcaceae cyanobacterium AMR_MDS_5431]|nr:N-acetylmuramoyl-L-alanine amidase [Prochlorococcaceae cyanobacterium AMR_MDS_5431]